MKKSTAAYKKGFFQASGIHKLYYELYGNPKGQKVVFLHGGPGAGFSKKDYAFFDPKKFNVLFFDQRGAGKSKAKVDQAKLVGKAIGEKAVSAGITTVVFDRNGYLYHGRIKSLAEAAREAGLKF